MKLSFLGDLRLGGELVRLGERLQVLLAMLALRPGVVQSRRQIAHLLWPESTHTQALGNLRKALHDLLQALPALATYLAADKQTVCLAATLDVDVIRFSQGVALADPEAAVALYQGDLLPGAVHPWVEAERDRLRLLYRDALGRLVTRMEGARRYDRACFYAQLALRCDPFHEELHRALMRLYASQGDLPAAIRTYQQCAALLQRELGVDPSPATREAYRQLLELEQAPLPPSPHHDLVGREAEWQRLTQAWRSVAAGGSHLALVTGESGIGKSRLAAELRGWVQRQGGTSAAAACYAAEGAVPLCPVTGWLRSLPLGDLPRSQRLELARLLPELGDANAPLTEPFHQQRWHDALARAILRRKPLLLVLDDLQWCDPDTLHFLRYLLRFEPTARLLIVGTVRLDELGAEHPLLALRTALRREDRLTEIALGPLSVGQSATLAQHATGRPLDAAAVERLHQETGGNPLFLLETLRAGDLNGRLPETVQSVLAARLAQLPPTARELAELAAVHGRAFDLDLLREACGLPRQAALASLELLWARGLVREEQAGQYHFAHDQLRQAVLAELSPLRRRHLHQVLAQTLLRLRADDPESVAGAVGAHYEQAGATREAAHQYLRAGAAARLAGAQETAMQYYQRALALLPEEQRGEALLRLGMLWLATGRRTEAEAALGQAAALLLAAGEPRLTAQAMTQLGVAARRGGKYAEAVRLLGEARDLHAAAGDRLGASQALAALANAHSHLGDLELALDSLAERMQFLAPGQDPRGDCMAQVSLCHAYFQAGDMERAREHYQTLQQMGASLQDPPIMAMGHSGLGYVALLLGDHTEALAQWQAWLHCCQETGDRLSTANAVGCLGAVLCEQGDTAAGLPALAYLARTGAEAGDPRSLFLGSCLLVGMLHGAGRTPEALALMAALLPLVRAMHAPYSLLLALQTHARLLVDTGRLAEASAAAEEGLLLAAERRNQHAEAELRLLVARIRLAAGQWSIRKATDELEQLLDLRLLPAQRVDLYDWLWQLEPARAEYRERAVSLLAEQYQRGPKWWYRRRYQALTGQHLPAPSARSVLPTWLPRTGLSEGDLQELIDLCKATRMD